MSRLSAELPLGGFSREYSRVSLSEPRDFALVSIAIPQGGGDVLNTTMSTTLGLTIPSVGSSTCSGDKTSLALGLQSDQLFLMFKYDGDDAVAIVKGKLGDAGYYTDQTDSWAMLSMVGPGSRPALRRICMLDLDPQQFPTGAVSRTTMEHLGVIILREAMDSFLLLSPRSSARSFLHAVETSINHTATP